MYTMEENNELCNENVPNNEELKVHIEDEQEILNEMDSLEKPEITKKKKPRSEAQIAAFNRAREVLAEKRKTARELKLKAPKKALGRPKKTVQEPLEDAGLAGVSVLKVKTKKPPIYIDETETESSEEEEPIVYVKKKPKKRRKKKPLKIVYVSASESSSDSEQEYESNQHQQPLERSTQQLQQQPAPPPALSFMYV